MSTRLIHTSETVSIDLNVRKQFKVFYDSRAGEYTVIFLVDAFHKPAANYYTDDKDDAIGTGNHWLNHE